MWTPTNWMSCGGGGRLVTLLCVVVALSGCAEKPPAAKNSGQTNPRNSGGEPAAEAPGPDLKKWEQMLIGDDNQAQWEGAAEFDRLAKIKMRGASQVTDQQAQEAVQIIKRVINDHWAQFGGSLEQLSLALIYLDGNDLKVTRAILNDHQLPHVRGAIVKSLGKRGNREDKSSYVGLFAQNEPQVEAAVQALVDVLKTDAEPDVREQAAQMLAHIGPDAKLAIPALGEVMQDEESNPRVRVAAGAAVSKISEKASP